MPRKEVLREIEKRIRLEEINESDPIVVIDSNSKIVLWNSASETIFGYSAEEVRGKDFNIVIPEEYHNLNKYRIRLMSQTGVAEFPKRPVELAVRNKDGCEVIGKFHPAMLKTKEGIFFSIIVRDVICEKHREATIDDHNTCPLSAESDFSKDFKKTVSMAGTFLKADFAVYQKISDSFLYCQASWNAPDDFEKMRKKRGTVCFSFITKNKQMPVCIQDLDKSAFARTDPTVKHNSLKAVIGVPVRKENKVIGALCVFYHEDKKPDENELRILALLSQALEDREARLETVEKFAQNRRKLEIAETNIRRISRQ
ncbi:MAG: PAS domain S-box protein, partial [Deltaproteobacteria bacterium]|nr:PAS domain S-box protein [Deltaproteobacteria bacterium]